MFLYFTIIFNIDSEKLANINNYFYPKNADMELNKLYKKRNKTRKGSIVLINNCDFVSIPRVKHNKT